LQIPSQPPDRFLSSPALPIPRTASSRSSGPPDAVVGEPAESFQQGAVNLGSLSLASSALPSAGTEVEMVVRACPDVAEADLERLKQTARRAVAYFREHFGPVTSPLVFEVGQASGALRTGFNLESGVIALPSLEGVRKSGLDSPDVINHEIFHALMFGAYPHLANKDQGAARGSVRLQEGLADLFAYRLSPDPEFGEKYYLAGGKVREYRTSMHVSLAAGAHAQGNAITSLLLEEEVEDGQIRRFLEAGDFRLEALGEVSPRLKRALEHDASLSLEAVVGPGYTPSRLGRYKLRPDHPLQIQFVPSDSLKAAHPDLRVDWTDKRGIPSKTYVFQETSANAFAITAGPEADQEKMIARFYSGDKLIGFRPFYFSTEG
jgi:hypothetical protein